MGGVYTQGVEIMAQGFKFIHHRSKHPGSALSIGLPASIFSQTH